MKQANNNTIALMIIISFAFIAAIIINSTKPDGPIQTPVVTEGNPAGVLMRVTAYCKESCCCGRFADGFTASGKPAVGLIAAAPPNIPFGTKLDVPGHGVVTVEDRGGAIKGNRLDLLFPSHQEALNWGVQYLEVRIVE